MTEKFKVLSAILALEEFTPDEVSRFSGVKINTVRTVLGRHSHLFEKIGQEETGHRGGQPTRHRLTPGGRAEAHSVIKETLASINGASVASALARMNLDTDVTKPARVPLGLSAAADTLNRLSVAQTRDEKIALLKLAETQVRSVLNETRSATDASVWLEASEKLREIQRRRAQLHEQQDVDVLHAIQSGGITKMLRRFARFSLKGGAAHSSTTQAQPRLQIWSALSTSDDSPLHARIAQSLQKRAELLVSEVPSDATQFAQLGDAVILVVNSQGADAGEQFRKAAEACSTSSTPLVVLDQTYSPGFRNLVLSVGNAQYYPDASALDSDGILNIIGHTPRRGTRTDFAVAPSTSLDKAKLRTRDNS